MQILTLHPGPHRKRIRFLARPTSESCAPQVWEVVPVASSEGSTCVKREARQTRAALLPAAQPLLPPDPSREPRPLARARGWAETVATPEPGRLAGRVFRDAAPHHDAAQSLSSARGRQRGSM